MFDWDDANLLHIAEHDVASDEAEEITLNEPLDLEYEHVAGEDRLRQVGETNQGRILAVVTTWRGEDIRVVTAYPASKTLRTLYLIQKGNNYG